MSALNNLSAQSNHNQLISIDYQRLLRIAALLHDVGHAAFSHVSEMALETLPALSLLGAEFSKRHRIEKKQLSEIFAFYIVKSPAVKNLFEVIANNQPDFPSFGSKADNAEEVAGKIAQVIIGQKIDDQIPLLHELISGPFDADKLDYFVRDAKFAGVPSVLDISRLVQKLAIKELEASALPPEIGRSVKQITGKYSLFGIRWSGIPVLDELQLGRVLLYAKVYRHPKVIAIEQMLKGALLSIADAASLDKVIRFVYKYSDDALLNISSSDLLSYLELNTSGITETKKEKIECALSIFRDVQLRRLSVRAFQVHRRYPFDDLENDETQKGGLIKLREALEHPELREEFRQKLIAEIESIWEALGEKKPSRAWLESQIMIHMHGQVSGGNQIARAFILQASGPPMPFLKYTVNRTAWADGYISDQPSGYIFAPTSVADAAYIAVEKLIRLEHSVKLPASALEASKKDSNKIKATKQRLSEKGFYQSVPYDLRPMPDRLEQADILRTIDELSQKFVKYSPPGGYQETIDINLRIFNWLRQFDNDDHIECAIRILKSFRFLTRADTANAIKRFIDANPNFRGSIVVPFGAMRDSGVMQTYFSADLDKSYVSACMTLDEVAKASSNAPLIIIDDFIGSGNQGQDILAAGFGMASWRKDLGESRDLFSGAAQDKLRNTKVGFVFVAAWNQGIDAITATAKEAGMDATVFRHMDEADIPFVDRDCLAGMDPAVVDKFNDRCSTIGAELIRSMQSQAGKVSDEKKVSERSLGYGNRSMLLGSHFNIPSQTMTLIWAKGIVEGVEWEPLLPRRKKT